MKIYCFSLNIKWEDKAENKNRIIVLLDDLDIPPHSLLIFPELTLTGFTMNSEKIAEQELESPSIKFFKGISKKYESSVLFGMALKGFNGIYNSAIFIHDKSHVVDRYDKLHMFSLAGENMHYVSGNQVKCIENNSAKIGISICYDLRFSHVYNAHKGLANLFINIANWPDIRRDHWITLLKARAIEFQSFFVGVNRSGEDPNGNSYSTGTLVFDPLGNHLEAINEKANVSEYEIDFSLVTDARNKMACITDHNKV